MTEKSLTQDESDQIAEAAQQAAPGATVTILQENDFDLGVGELDTNLPPLDTPTLSVLGINVTGAWRHPDYGRYQVRVHVATIPRGLSVTGDNMAPLEARINIVALAVESALRKAEARWRVHEETEKKIAPKEVTKARTIIKVEDKAEEL